MRIFRVLFYHSVEVSDSLSMITDHLEGFGPLMHILHVLGDAIDALSQREDRFLELLLPTIRQSHMVVNIWLVGDERLVTQRGFHRFETLLVLTRGKEGQPQVI